MTPRRYKLISGLLTMVTLAVLGYLKYRTPAPPVFDPSQAGRLPGLPELSKPRLCTRVIDGDTVELEGGERVRLIGVDTPESADARRPVERFGKEATAFTRRLAEGKWLRLQAGGETRDAYDRTLAYIYLPDNTLLNAEIIRQGYGFAYTRFPHPRFNEFVALEREAREGERGLWRKASPDPSGSN